MKSVDLAAQAREGVGAPPAESQTARVAVLAVLAALLLFASLRGQGLAGYDDAVYAYEGREMLRTGDWWNIRFNGNLNFEYPPLFLWMEAASFKVFGANDAAAKVPSALLGFGTILLTYFLAVELTGQAWLSLLAMIVLASTQFFLKNATHAMTDVPFTFFFALAIYFYIKGLKSKPYLLFFGVPLGLALLTRSVIGFLVAGIVVGHAILTKRYRVLGSPWFVGGIVLGLVLPSVWCVSQGRLHGAASFASHLRFVTGKIYAESGTTKWATVFNYPVALLKYYWPWLPFLLAGLFMAAKAAVRQKEEAAILLIVWVLVILVPFSLVQTRYPRYIMPVFPAFSILSAIALDHWLPVSRRKVFFNLLCGVGCLAICLSFLFPPKARAGDMVKLAPIAEANSSPDQRILIYTYEDGRRDYLCQFVWYSNRYAQLADNLDDLAVKLHRTDKTTVIIDKQSYGKLLPLIPEKTPQVLGESENLICFRSS